MCAGCSNSDPSTIPTETIDTSATNPTKSTEATAPANDPLSFITPAIKDDGSTKGKAESGLYIYNDGAYRGFSGKNENAKAYANVMNSIKKKMGEDANVYSILVPTHIETGLPARLKNSSDGVVTNSQSDYIKTAYQAMEGVKPINVYNNLAQHCNDKIYFNTDYRWTGLGAYYGYTAFAQAVGNQPILLEAMKKNSISGFTGYYEAGYDLGLKSESIDYWESEDYDVTIDITRPDGEVVKAYSCFYDGETAPSDKIIVFLQGDYPVEAITSTSDKAKDKICIVHEGFANPMISYFTYNYKEVYSVNMSKWTGNIKEFCKDNGIKNLLFVHDTASSANQDTINQLKDIIS